MTPYDDYLSPQAFLFLLLAFVVGLLVLAVVHAEHRRAARREARAEARRKARREAEAVRVHPRCVIWGHKYAAHSAVWLCGVCGDRIPRDTMTLEDEETA